MKRSGWVTGRTWNGWSSQTSSRCWTSRECLRASTSKEMQFIQIKSRLDNKNLLIGTDIMYLFFGVKGAGEGWVFCSTVILLSILSIRDSNYRRQLEYQHIQVASSDL